MAKIWVLDTGTKGTGAEVVPLEKVLRKPAAGAEPALPPPKRRPRPAPQPAPRQPRKFRVVDVMTEQVLAEDAGARSVVDLLKDVRSVVDVRIYVWQPRAKKWRLLTFGEQKAMWERRGERRQAAPTADLRSTGLVP
jgi:hypothetical protein